MIFDKINSRQYFGNLISLNDYNYYINLYQLQISVWLKMFGGVFWVEGAEGTGNFIVCDEMVILLKSFIYCTFN